MLELFLATWTFIRVLSALGGKKKNKAVASVVRINDSVVLVRGSGFVGYWQPVDVIDGYATRTDKLESMLGLTIPYPIGGAVLSVGSYDFADLTPPPGRYFVERDGALLWDNDVEADDVIIAYVVRNSIFIKENKMSYATGKSDLSDYKKYNNVSLASWPGAPFKGCPIKLVNGVPSPATSSDEVVYAIVDSLTAIQDDQGATTGYDITALVSEGDISLTHGVAQEHYGKPLYVQNYTYGGTTAFADVYSHDAPAVGFTHPVFLINDASTLHYNGTIRPAVV